MKSLDSILSRDGEAVPSTDNQIERATTVEAVTTETTEGEAQTEQAADTTEPGKSPPIGAIRQSEREKATKRYTEQVAEFDRKLSENNAAWERRFNQLLERLTPQQPKEEPKDWFADPDAAFKQNFQQSLNPVMQQHQQGLNTIQQTREYVSRRFAEMTHGKDVITSAYQALEQRLQSDPSAGALYQQIMSSPDPWDTLAQWHKRESFMAEAGSDLDAYKAKLKAELLAELQQGNGQQSQQQQAKPLVMPTNLAAVRNVGSRSGPAWAGPQDLKSIFKGR